MEKFTIKTKSGSNISGKHVKFPLKTKRNLKIDFIFVHAFPLDSEMYVKNFEELKINEELHKISSVKGDVRIILPDLPGFGKSELFNLKPLDLMPYVESINEIVNYFKIKKLILGGCSMGGYIALEYLRNHPKIIEGLVLIDTKPYTDNKEQTQNRLDTIDIIERSLKSYSRHERSIIIMEKLYNQDENIKVFIDNLHSRIISRITQQKRPEIAKRILNLMIKQKALGIIHALSGMAGRKDTSSLLKNFKKNTLIIVGENDIITPLETAKEMKHLITRVTLEIIPFAGHLSNMENLFEFNHRLSEWLRIKF